MVRATPRHGGTLFGEIGLAGVSNVIPCAAGSCLPASRSPQTASVGWPPSSLTGGFLTCMLGGEMSSRGSFPALRLELVSRLMKAWSPGLSGYSARRQHCLPGTEMCIVHCKETASVPRKMCFLNLWSVLFTDSQLQKTSSHFSSSHKKGSYMLCDHLAVLISIHIKDGVTRRSPSGRLHPRCELAGSRAPSASLRPPPVLLRSAAFGRLVPGSGRTDQLQESTRGTYYLWTDL